jgi:hypothetical protein
MQDQHVTAADHTRIVELIAEHMPDLYRLCDGQKPKSGREVLQAALRLQAQDIEKERAHIEMAVQIDKQLRASESGKAGEPDEILGQLLPKLDKQNSIEGQEDVLQQAIKQYGNAAKGAEFGTEIIRDGKNTIYSDDWWSATLEKIRVRQSKVNVPHISREDVKGAIGGAILGAISGPGVLLGAFGGAVVASVEDIVDQLWPSLQQPPR